MTLGSTRSRPNRTGDAYSRGREFPWVPVDSLRLNGHDVSWVRTDYRGWKDPKLLDLAEGESRIVFTLDKDLSRIHPTFAEVLRPFVRDVVESTADLRGRVTVVTRRAVERVPFSEHFRSYRRPFADARGAETGGRGAETDGRGAETEKD